MKFGSAKATEAASESTAGGGGRYIKSFRDQETNLRFLDELDTWYAYWEHFDQGKSRSFPCTRDRDTCPGCTSENERTASASKRYLTNAVREYKGKEYVDLFKIPVSLMDAIQRRFDKDGTVVNARNYTIAKTGKGTDTKYILEWDEKTRIDLDRYEGDKQDFEEALTRAYEEVWGPMDGEPAKPAVAVVKTEAKAKAEPPFEPDPPKQSFPDDPPSEPEAATEQDAAEDEEDEVISEEALRQMSASQLKVLYSRCGIAVPEELDDAAPKLLADYLIDKLG